MTAKICPHCHARNFTDNPRCSYCGGLLETPAAKKPGPPPPIEPSGSPSSPSRTAGKPSPLSPPRRPTSSGGSSSSPLTPPSSPVPTSSSPVPYSSSPMSPSSSRATYPGPPLPLPSHLAHLSGPDLEGEVIDTDKDEMKAPTDTAGDALKFIFSLMLLPFQPFMILMYWILGGRKSLENQTVYVFRVRRWKGTPVQARIEQDIIGANINIGDYVSMWGTERSGVLIVKRAYNHTIAGEVKLHQKIGPVLNQIFLVIVILFFIFICFWLWSVIS